MTLANKSLEKKNFHRVENVIKQLVLIGQEARVTQLLRIFRALRTSRVLQISMNARWRMSLIEK